ncbi:MAG: hypothetical protein LBK76_10950 [Verrucomicrobiales bacterium]|jgi:hypothetical protein|nr:hypothetical protein [Verrucomicrobiales bacterium]
MKYLALIIGLFAASASAIEIKYQSPKDAMVSLGLFDREGKLLRWLRMNEFARQGENLVGWDGLDQWGQPLPAGDYLLKGVWHGPLTLEHQATVNNPGNPPWPTADGKGDWLSDEASPQAAATDGDWVFLGAPGAEDGSSIIAVDGAGQRQWGYMYHCYPRSVALTVDGDYLYALFSGPESAGQPRVYPGGTVANRALLVCLDKKTGSLARFSREQPRLKIAEWAYSGSYRYMWELRNEQSFTLKEYGGQPRYFSVDVAEPAGAVGLAAAGDKLYVAFMDRDKIAEYDAATGAATGVEITVSEPGGLCRLNDNALLAVSGRQVVTVNLLTKKVTPFIIGGLSAPAYVTTDRTGNIYVSDWADSLQVKQFDRSGRLLKALGKKGGRPWAGKWEPGGMLLPRGIAVTNSGRLWVAEDDMTPKRVSVWDTASGKLAREFVGPASYGGGGYTWANPLDVTEVFSGATLFKADLAKKSGAPVQVAYRRRDVDDVFTPNGGEVSEMTRAYAHHGEQYVMMRFNRTGYTIMQRIGNDFRPVAAIGHRIMMGRKTGDNYHQDGTSIVQWDSDIGHHRYDGFYPDCFREHANENYCWADANGDGKVQPAEMRWYPLTGAGAAADGRVNKLEMYWGTNLAPDLSFLFITGADDGKAVMRLEPEWRGDVPVYDFSKAKLLARTRGLYPLSLHVTRDEKILVFVGYENSTYPNSVECYDYHGNNLWNIALPKKLAGEFAVHGSGLAYDYEIPGLGVVCLTWNWHGSYRSYMFTSSGDYLWSPLDDNHNAGPFASWGESFRGGVQAADGTPYLLNGANGQAHLLQIKGLEPGAVGRFEHPFTVSAADAQAAAAEREQPPVRVAPRPVIGVSWEQSAAPVVVDGQLDDWNMGEGVKLDGDQGRRAVVALRRDRDRLYLAYQVWEPAPLLRNAGADWQQLFISGDCVDLMLESDPLAAAHRTAPADGDRRLLLGVFENRPVAVLYQPVVPGTKDPTLFMAASIDRVAKLSSAKVAVSRDPAEGCYVIEASVPLADLGIDPKNTGRLRGDVGVVFADATGRSRAQRLYYYNHSQPVNITEDLTTEATLQPSEWGEIRLPLGENLLKNGGFESALAEREHDGWQAWDNQNGAVAGLSGSVAYTGSQAAYLRVTEPLDIPEDAFKLPDFHEFLKTARGGTNVKGQVAAGVRQRVPVIAGHRYSVRYSYRSADMQDGGNRPGPGRGFAAIGGRLVWNKGNGNNLGSDSVAHDDWQTVQDYGAWYISRPFTAPEGATEVLVNFNLDVRAANRRSEVWLDNVEMVDVTE